MLSISFVFISCNSPQPTTDTDIFDKDIVEIDDTDEDSVITDLDNTLIDYESDTDEQPDDDEPLYPPQKCIEMEEGNPESLLCFGPRRVEGECNLPTEVGVNVELFTGYVTDPGEAWGFANINNDFIFFGHSPASVSGHRSVYGCDRKQGELYAILETTLYHVSGFSADGNNIAFSINIENSGDGGNFTIYLGDLNTLEIYAVSKPAHWINFSLHWPHLTATDIGTNKLTIFNLETGTSLELDTPRGRRSHSDGTTAIITGTYRTDEYGTNDINGVWRIDLATEEVHPVVVSPYEDNLRKMTNIGKIENGRIVLLSGRDIRYTGTLSGLDVVLYDMKTGRETLPAPPFDLSEHFHDRFNPFVNYPYIGWCDTWDTENWAGPSSVINIETGELWTDLTGGVGHRDTMMKKRHILKEPVIGVNVTRLPDPGDLPTVDCDDNNECTDDSYHFDSAGCAHEVNNNRCSKGICIEKECVSFPAPTIEDNEMVVITPDSGDPFLIDIYELTNSKYAACVAAGVCRKPERNNSMLREKYYENPEYDNYPVVYINRENAENYCIWQGKRLPTEKEFEAALDRYPPTANVAGWKSLPLEGWDVAEVGTFGDVLTKGTQDMNGNVCEWMSHGYHPDSNPELFPDEIGVIRGGCHDLDPGERFPMTVWSLSVQVGFRCTK